jgi:hypothetical protein
MRAKKVAHVCQRPPFNTRASYCARRTPQRPFYARPGCAGPQEVMRAKKKRTILGNQRSQQRPQRPRYFARA